MLLVVSKSRRLLDDSFVYRLNILLIKCWSFRVRTKALFVYFVQQSSKVYLIWFCFYFGTIWFLYVCAQCLELLKTLWFLLVYVRLLNQSISSACFEIISLYKYPLIKFYWTVEKWHIILHFTTICIYKTICICTGQKVCQLKDNLGK